MDKKLPFISYTLAVLSGICFVGGLVILSSERENTQWTDLERLYQY